MMFLHRKCNHLANFNLNMLHNVDTWLAYCVILYAYNVTCMHVCIFLIEWRKLLQPSSPTDSEQTHYSTPTHTKVTKGLCLCMDWLYLPTLKTECTLPVYTESIN